MCIRDSVGSEMCIRDRFKDVCRSSYNAISMDVSW
jgi:hypothetical protein